MDAVDKMMPLLYAVVAPLVLAPHIYPGLKKLKVLLCLLLFDTDEKLSWSDFKTAFKRKFSIVDVKRFIVFKSLKLFYILITVAGLVYMSCNLGLFLIGAGKFFMTYVR